jgi:glycosyltransferase involved in cell wall biosynthesis
MSASGGGPIRIAHVIDILARGGAQTWLLLLVEGLARLGHRQRVICLNERYDADIVKRLRDCGVAVTVVGRPRLYALAGFVQVARELRRERPHVVQTCLPFADVIGRALARLVRVPRIVSVESARYVDKWRAQFALDRATVRWVDRVVFMGRETIPFAVAHEGVRAEQVVYIPNGVAPPPPGWTAARSSLRGRHGVADGACVLGMAARLHPQKGHQFLLEAFSRVARLHPGTVLWLVGDGPLRRKLERHATRLGIRERVVFAGDQIDVWPWLAAMDIFVHPTLFEGMPYSVLEAMAAAKPVVASRVDGTQSLILEGESGWLVEPGDVEGLVRRLSYVVDHPEEAARVGRAAADLVAREYSAERMVAAYDALYRELLSGPRAGSAPPVKKD